MSAQQPIVQEQVPIEQPQGQAWIVFVNNLNGTVTSRDLAELGAATGPINSTVVSFDRDGNPLGYGFVEFATEQDANAFIDANHGRECCGTNIECSAFVPLPGHPSPLRSNTLFLTNFPPQFTKEDIDAFVDANCGEFVSSDVFQNQETGVIYAFVTFNDGQQVLGAVDRLHGFEFQVDGGEPLNLYADIVQVADAVRIQTHLKLPALNFISIFIFRLLRKFREF